MLTEFMAKLTYRYCFPLACGVMLGVTLSFMLFGLHRISNHPSALHLWAHHYHDPHVDVSVHQTQQRSPFPFKALYSKVKNELNDSLYFFDRPGRLIPMMRRMSESENRREHRLAVGRAWLRTQGVIVAATVRNGMSGLPSSMQNLRRLRALFNASWLVFVENDSKDATRTYLYNISLSDPSLTLLGCDTINSPTPCKLDIRYSSGKNHEPGWHMQRSFQDQVDRGFVMSALRNLYLNYIYDNLADKAALLLMIDPDITWSDWDIDNIAQGAYYFKTKPKLEQLCAHTIDTPRHAIYDPCTLTFFINKHYGEDTKYPVVNYDTSLKNAPGDLPPVKVESCFQAFAFYRLSRLSNTRLQYSRSPGEWMCEHNTLSRQLKEVYIDPQMRLQVRAANVG